MKLSIEKRPANNEESYFVLTSGEKKIEMAVNAVKVILLLWVFCSVTMFSYIVGLQTAYNGLMSTAFIAKGNLVNEKGEHVDCNPILTDKRSLEWNCTIQNLTVKT